MQRTQRRVFDWLVRFLCAAVAELLMGDRSRIKVTVDIQSLKSLSPTADKQHPNPQAAKKAATKKAERSL